MHGNKGFNWFVVALGFIIILWSVVPVADLDDKDLESTVIISEPERSGFLGGTPHAPIVIDGDVNFSETASDELWFGDGSSENPYIINGYDIDLGGAAGHCINITNTRVNFIISNCNLTGASVSPGSGIYLYNVTNGELINNTCANNIFGIQLQMSSFNTVGNNTCDNNDNGIMVVTGGSNKLINNTCRSNNFNGILLTSSLSNNVTSNTASNNNAHGIYLYSLNSNNRVTDNYCDNNNYGIAILWQALHNTVVNNTCTNNNYGIRVENSQSGQTVINNTFDSNFYGIYIYISDYNTLTNNTCTNNAQYGIYLHDLSDLNDIQWNVFVNSSVNGWDASWTDNVFDHNYWSDYAGTDANGDGFGDAPYTFAGNSDSHPLMFLPTPPRWTGELPAFDTVLYGYPTFQYEFHASAPSPIFWLVSDTMTFNIDSNGVLMSNDILRPGNYELKVMATNIYGFSISTTFHVTVVLDANNPPGWFIIPTDQMLDYNEEFDYQVIAIDPSGIDRWELNDTTHFNLEASFYIGGSTARITSNSILEPNSYVLNLTVYDIYDNGLSVIFTVTIEPPEQDLEPMVTLSLGVGIGAAAVLLIVFVLFKKRS